MFQIERSLLPMSSIAEFQPHQIVCLTHKDKALYAEVIQFVAKRGLCWVRPLALLQVQRPDAIATPSTIYDLRQGADLLCPHSLFRVALDTEVIPILTELNTLKNQSADSGATASENSPSACYSLQNFIRQVWQAFPEAFQPQQFTSP